VYPQGDRMIQLQDRTDNPDIRPLRDVSTGNHLRTDARNCFYPIFVKSGEIIGFGDVSDDSYHPESANVQKSDGVIEIYPIDANGNERKWVWARHTVESIRSELRVVQNSRRGVLDIERVKTHFNHKTVWNDDKYNANSYGTKLLAKLMPNCGFDFPKSLYTVLDCVKAVTINDQNAIALDFFSGSGTTAHAVMQLNAEDGGKRRFIMVQLDEDLDKSLESATGETKKSLQRSIRFLDVIGKPHLLSEIGKERIRRAGEKLVDSLQLSVNSKGSLQLSVASREVMKQNGCIKLSRSDCLAKGDGTDGSNLFSGQEIAKRGDLRSVGPDETSGSVNSLEHSGGAGEKHEQGIHSVSGYSTGIEGGIGDSIIDLRQGGTPCRFGHFGSDRIDTGNRQNAECSHYKTENCKLKTGNWTPDIGFRVLKLADTNMNDVYYAAGDYTQDMIMMMQSNIKPDRTDIRAIA